jgi:hypothetical protein
MERKLTMTHHHIINNKNKKKRGKRGEVLALARYLLAKFASVSEW